MRNSHLEYTNLYALLPGCKDAYRAVGSSLGIDTVALLFEKCKRIELWHIGEAPVISERGEECGAAGLVSGEYYRLLVRRAGVFMEVAESLLERGVYDLAVFNAEQAVKLRLKSILYRLWGLTPRSHSIRWLLGMLRDSLLKAGLVKAAERIDEFVRANRVLLSALEDAYTLARYGHMEYEQEIVSKLVRLAKNLLGLLEEVERDAVNMGEVGA